MDISCYICGVVKDVTQFLSWRNIRSDGYRHMVRGGKDVRNSPICKKCNTRRSLRYRMELKDKRKVMEHISKGVGGGGVW